MNQKTEKAIGYFGFMLILIAIAFVFVHFSVAVVSEGSVTKDLMGFVVPDPPAWASFIPFSDYTFQLFSLHGLVGLAITLLIMGTGVGLVKVGKDNSVPPVSL